LPEGPWHTHLPAERSHARVTARAHTGEAEAEAAGGAAYFVCGRLGAPLARLPRAGPAHIAAAQRVKRFLTGRLDARVASYPPFAGSEAHLLAAQARPRRRHAAVPMPALACLLHTHMVIIAAQVPLFQVRAPSLVQAAPGHTGRRSILTQRPLLWCAAWLA